MEFRPACTGLRIRSAHGLVGSARARLDGGDESDAGQDRYKRYVLLLGVPRLALAGLVSGNAKDLPSLLGYAAPGGDPAACHAARYRSRIRISG